MGVIDEVWNSIFTNQYIMSVLKKHLNNITIMFGSQKVLRKKNI